MRILQITSGAANMYCGSCLRDNALARQLLQAGHDVVLVPVYTPTLTEEKNVSQEQVLFGGISVYLQQKSALFRHTPAWLDRAWDSNWALRKASSGSIPVDPKFLGEMTVSMLQGSDGPLRKEFAKLAAWMRNEPKFDVINLPFTLLIAFAKTLRRVSKAPIVCTLQGEDLFLEGLQEPWRSEALALIKAQLHEVDLFLATSHYYAKFMQEYLQIPAEKIRVAQIGIDFTELAPKERPGTEPLRIGFFARIAPEKGLHQLLEAHMLLRERGGLPKFTLHAAGMLLAENRAYLHDLELKSFGKGFQYHGILDRKAKIEFLQSIDVFSVPTTYREPKGLFLLEALATGCPVVQPNHGAFPELLAATGGGLLVEPGSTAALADGLAELLLDAGRRKELSAAGARNVREKFSLERMGETCAAIYAEAIAGSYSN